jgi:hypothetical protein
MRVEKGGRTVRLPDFLFVGAGKSGTTSLYNYLKQHPQIFMPKKDPAFFTYAGEPPRSFEHPRYTTQTIYRFDEYARLFEPAGEDQVLGDCSTAYLAVYERTINNVKKHIPDWQKLKIVMILRYPAERVFSLYSMLRMHGEETLEFEEALDPVAVEKRLNANWSPMFDYMRHGFYYESVKAYIDNFPHVKVYLLDDLKADVVGLVRDLSRFLEVDDSFVPDISMKYMTSGEPKFGLLNRLLSRPGLAGSVFPPIKLIPLEKRVELLERFKSLFLKRIEMKEETRAKLRAIYREDILKLQTLIGRDLGGWLK